MRFDLAPPASCLRDHLSETPPTSDDDASSVGSLAGATRDLAQATPLPSQCREITQASHWHVRR
jgi:hypothetical protein